MEVLVQIPSKAAILKNTSKTMVRIALIQQVLRMSAGHMTTVIHIKEAGNAG